MVIGRGVGNSCNYDRFADMSNGSELEIDETIRLGLDAVKEAQRRTRICLSVSVVLSVMIFIVCWNAYYSWYRGFSSRSAWAKNEVVQNNQKELIATWIRSRTISLPLVGVSVGVSDVAILGSVSLLVASIWFWLSAKQENRVIGTLLIEHLERSPATRRFVFDGITSYMVFTQVKRAEHPIRSLRDNLVAPQVSIPLVFRTLILLPAIACGFQIFSDIYSVFGMSSPFRDFKQGEDKTYVNDGSGNLIRDPLWQTVDEGQKIQILFMLLIAVALAVCIIIICSNIIINLTATSQVLQEYSGKIVKDEEELRQQTAQAKIVAAASVPVDVSGASGLMESQAGAPASAPRTVPSKLEQSADEESDVASDEPEAQSKRTAQPVEAEEPDEAGEPGDGKGRASTRKRKGG